MSLLNDPKVPSAFNRRRLTVATLGTSDAAIARAYTSPKSVRESTMLSCSVLGAVRELELPLPGAAEEANDEMSA